MAESGAIVKVCDPNCVSPTTSYHVTWNGHGDALALWRINADGTLTLANSYTYSTWGTPQTFTHNGIADLGFRFLYVGQHGVAWDDAFGLGLAYMSARHYSPAIGRFLQPDPTAQEANLYAYAGNSPVTRVDPDGEFAFLVGILIVARFLWTAGRVALVAAPRLAPATAWLWLRAQGYRWNPHLFNHGVRLWEVARTIAFGEKFRYFHRGECKIGFVMWSTGLFVATSLSRSIFTSFYPGDGSRSGTWRYVHDLKAHPC